MRWRRLVPLVLLVVLIVLLGEVPRGQSGDTALVYVTETGHRYHCADCRYLSSSRIGMPLEAAVEAGYTPCSVCKPPVRPEERPSSAKESAARPWGAPVAAELTPVKFIRVVDGDTLHLVYRQRDTAVRLIGIDTPELHYRRGHPDYPEPYARKADDYLGALVKGRELLVELDVERRDRYGRTLAYLWARGDGDSALIFVNAQLLRAGLAQVLTIPPNVKYVERLLAAQHVARNEGIGLWTRGCMK